ncbi:sensor domain-containing diguanylate cyclase [Brevibacillus sp. AY1]|uniref:diguanylate cyclase domain-containing protein n=1 Tax=Brevibacillus sp. AY1 TaxID=2807621 RepID=UPI00245764AF|nr:sensor domain-containing diguanylate cyclase [Brevibacillus sp. AY1]
MSMMNFGANEIGKRNITTLINQYGDILSDLFEHISDMLFLMSVEEVSEGEYQFRYVLMNPSAMRYAQLDKTAYGKRFEDVYPAEKAAALVHMYEKAVTSRNPVHQTNEDDIIGESILTPVINTDGVCTHVFAVTRDITERKQLEAKLEFMAYHDVLTGLPNRRLLELQLERALHETKDDDEMVAVLFLDCDYFKQINDTWGHATGDAFLQMLAERLQACVRDEDTVSRLGGDEFVVVIRHVQHPTQAEEVAARILKAIEEPWQVQDATFTVTSSIGIALFPLNAATVEELLNRADEALYLAKETGRNQFYRFPNE